MPLEVLLFMVKPYSDLLQESEELVLTALYAAEVRFNGIPYDPDKLVYFMIQALQIIYKRLQKGVRGSQFIICLPVEILEVHAKAESLIPDPALNSGTCKWQVNSVQLWQSKNSQSIIQSQGAADCLNRRDGT